MLKKRAGLPDPKMRPTLSVPEAGAFLGLGKNSAYEAAKRGEIPAIKLGERLRVPTAKLYELLGIPLPKEGPRKRLSAQRSGT